MVEEGFYVRGEGLGSLHTQLLVGLLNVSMVLGERRDGRREEGWEERGGMGEERRDVSSALPTPF